MKKKNLDFLGSFLMKRNSLNFRAKIRINIRTYYINFSAKIQSSFKKFEKKEKKFNFRAKNN